jgi:hypothetical protein
LAALRLAALGYRWQNIEDIVSIDGVEYINGKPSAPAQQLASPEGCSGADREQAG